MLCKNYLVFFKLVEFRCEGELKEEDLVFVMSMALITKNKKKNDYNELAKKMFRSVNLSNANQAKKTISFDEFYWILIEKY